MMAFEKRQIQAVLAVALSIGVAACSSAKKRPGVMGPEAPGSEEYSRDSSHAAEEQKPNEVSGPLESYGPEAPADAPAKKPPLHLVFTSNNAGSLALAGVLSQLEREKLKVGQVTTSGVGAWISMLYGFSKTANDFEFALMRVSDRAFSDLDEAKKQLENLGKRDLSESRVVLELCAVDEGSKQPRLVTSGLASDWIFNALKNPCSEEQILRLGSSKPEQKMVRVDFAPNAAAPGADGEIVVNSKNAPAMKRTDWIFRGKKSVSTQKRNLQ